MRRHRDCEADLLLPLLSSDELLLTKFLFAFEAASVLLLIAAVGAIVLAGRKRDETEEVGA